MRRFRILCLSIIPALIRAQIKSCLRSDGSGDGVHLQMSKYTVSSTYKYTTMSVGTICDGVGEKPSDGFLSMMNEIPC